MAVSVLVVAPARATGLERLLGTDGYERLQAALVAAAAGWAAEVAPTGPLNVAARTIPTAAPADLPKTMCAYNHPGHR